MSERSIILIGGKPGSGKSRLGRGLAAHLENEGAATEHLSIGDHIRKIGSGALTSVYQEYVTRHLEGRNAHRPMKSDVIYDIMYFFALEHEEKDILLLDGYPRQPEQVEHVFDIARSQERTIQGMLHTTANDTIALERLLKNRSGHRPGMDTHIALERIEHHKRTFRPIIAELTDRQLPVREINTEGDKDTSLAQGLAYAAQMLYPPDQEKHAS